MQNEAARLIPIHPCCNVGYEVKVWKCFVGEINELCGMFFMWSPGPGPANCAPMINRKARVVTIVSINQTSTS